MDSRADKTDSSTYENRSGYFEAGYSHASHAGRTLVARCIAMAVSTKNRNFNDDEYEKGVMSPYKSLQLLEQAIEKEQREPTTEEMRKAIGWLESIFDTKKVPAGEQRERFEEIFASTGSLPEDAMIEAGHR